MASPTGMIQMISEEEARSKILETIQRLPTRRIPLTSALDCFGAEDLFARVPLPKAPTQYLSQQNGRSSARRTSNAWAHLIRAGLYSTAAIFMTQTL